MQQPQQLEEAVRNSFSIISPIKKNRKGREDGIEIEKKKIEREEWKLQNGKERNRSNRRQEKTLSTLSPEKE